VFGGADPLQQETSDRFPSLEDGKFPRVPVVELRPAVLPITDDLRPVLFQVVESLGGAVDPSVDQGIR
jgi:hypothetical protein